MVVQSKILWGYAAAVVALVVAGVAALWTEIQNIETFRWVDHTHEVLDTLDVALVDLLNTETGARGFVISGDASFLEPYQAGLASIDNSLARARELTADNPHQQRRLDELESLVKKKTEFQERMIQLRRDNDSKGAQDLLISGQGRQWMIDIRKIFRDAKDEEIALLKSRSGKAQQFSRTSIVITIIVALGAVSLVGIAGLMVRRDVIKLDAASAAAAAANLQLNEVNKELEAFSYSVSHDLRAPLRHIHGYVEMLSRDMEKTLSDKGKRYLKTISDASREMGQLIDDLLMLSRMGRMEMRQSAVSLDELVRETIRKLDLPAERHINWKIAALPAVIADFNMLRQVVVNLIENAVKYTRPRDPAEIEIAIAGEENGRVIIMVRDNGVGFDPQYAHKLFSAFQRLHRAEEFEGTGIGLANVRRIITRHGGRAWAESKPGEGASFYFTVQPAAAAS